jgi:hypothetical protein
MKSLVVVVGLGAMLALAGQAGADGPAPGMPPSEQAVTSDHSIASPPPPSSQATSEPTRPRAVRGERYRSTGPVVTSGSGRTFVLGGTGNWWGRMSSGLR